MTALMDDPFDDFGMGLVTDDIEEEEPLIYIPDPIESAKRAVGYSVPEGVSDKTFRHIISAAYTAYVGCRGIPSVDDIYHYSDKRVTKAKISAVTITPEFIEAMQSRGISWRPDDYTGISAAQQYAIQIITNPVHEKKTLQQKLKLAGITYTQYRAWLKQPTFERYLNKLTEGMLSDHIGDLHTALMQKALAGDLNSIKYVHELNGRHDPNRQQIEDLSRVVDMLVEIITQEVTDPETLTRIANKMQIATAKVNIKGEIANV